VLNRPAIILGDLHLGPTCPSDTEQAAATVIRRHPTADVLLLGDTLDLSLDSPQSDPGQSAARHLATNQNLRLALREQLQRGASVLMFAGNHDAQLAQPGVRAQLLETLQLTEDAPLDCGLWCVRRAGVHLEHGNGYDPDNTNAHPLVAPSTNTEPLGIVMMRRVLAPTDSLFFAHAHEMTPWEGLSQAFVRLGTRAPQLIARYYYEATKVFLRAGAAGFSAEQRLGAERLAAYARTHGFETDELERVLGLRAFPRHRSKRDVFFRLYLDRSLATVLWSCCGLVGGFTASPAQLTLAGLGLGYLGWSLSRGKNRYSGRLVPRLREAARAVGKQVGARAVIFGHTHVEEDGPGYANTGSFGFGGRNGRSYLLLESTPALFRMSVTGAFDPRPLDVFVDEPDVRTDPGVAA